MKTLSAALVVLTAFAAPAALAEPTREIRVAFRYNTGDTAEHIYARLESTVRDTCEYRNSRSLQMRQHELACIKEMLDEGVSKLNRPDIAALHNGGFVTAATATRG